MNEFIRKVGNLLDDEYHRQLAVCHNPVAAQLIKQQHDALAEALKGVPAVYTTTHGPWHEGHDGMYCRTCMTMKRFEFHRSCAPTAIDQPQHQTPL